MPFQDVTTAEGIPEVSGPVKVECLSIEDATEGEFGPQMRWSFRVWDNEGTEITWPDGTTFEWHQYTSDKTSPSATATQWAQALLGRPLLENEQGIAIQEALIGTKANAFAETRTSARGNDYSKISAISPIAQTALEPEEEAVPF